MFSINFNVMSVEEQFKKNLPACYNMFSINYDEKTIAVNAKELWSKFGEDIKENIIGVIGEVDLDNEFDRTKAVLNDYINFMKDHEGLITSVETYWSDMVRQAMMDNAQSLFNAKGPCNFYGDLIED